jgi:hypothetical protein
MRLISKVHENKVQNLALELGGLFADNLNEVSAPQSLK